MLLAALLLRNGANAALVLAADGSIVSTTRRSRVAVWLATEPWDVRPIDDPPARV